MLSAAGFVEDRAGNWYNGDWDFMVPFRVLEGSKWDLPTLIGYLIERGRIQGRERTAEVNGFLRDSEGNWSHERLAVEIPGDVMARATHVVDLMRYVFDVGRWSGRESIRIKIRELLDPCR